MNRRSFLKASLGTTAISLCSAPALLKAAEKKYDKHIPIGLELYSLRDVINHDTFPKYLKWVAETGFEVVEFAGYHGYSAKELRTMLDDYGIKASSTHGPSMHRGMLYHIVSEIPWSILTTAILHRVTYQVEVFLQIYIEWWHSPVTLWHLWFFFHAQHLVIGIQFHDSRPL